MELQSTPILRRGDYRSPTSGTERFRQIFCADRSGISICLGMASPAPVFEFIHKACDRPFRLRLHTHPAKMPEQAAPFHTITTVSRMASGGTPRRPSSRTVFKDERDRPRQAFASFLPGSALAVGSRNLGTVGDIPFVVVLDDRREFVVHSSIPWTQYWTIYVDPTKLW